MNENYPMCEFCGCAIPNAVNYCPSCGEEIPIFRNKDLYAPSTVSGTNITWVPSKKIYHYPKIAESGTYMLGQFGTTQSGKVWQYSGKRTMECGLCRKIVNNWASIDNYGFVCFVCIEKIMYIENVAEAQVWRNVNE